jgi:hypothetical protein
MSVDKILKLINERDDFKCQKNEIGLGEIFEESKEIKEIMSLFGYNRKYK